MAPKSRARKMSTTSKDGSANAKAAKEATKSMPPPPDRLPSQAILEPEMRTLSECLKNATIKTGQIYRFYADTYKLGIQRLAPDPPRSLTASLGREIEKYDQLCDSIESHLLRAIAVLQRDLVREERRIKAAETASIASRTRSKSTSMSPTSTRAPLPLVSGTDATSAGEMSQSSIGDTSVIAPQPSPPRPGSSTILGRRPSAISISSLHRPVFPPKLDLSAASLRISAEEASLFSSGLASPVTLAPKSARPVGPNEFPPEFIAAFASASSTADATNTSVDLDLTLPDTGINTGNDVEMNLQLDAAIGNSADKPIELDLETIDMDIDMDMTELFGDPPDSASNDGNAAVDGLFSPVPGGIDMSIQGSDGAGKTVKDDVKLEMELLDVFNSVRDNSGEDMFASFGTNVESDAQSHQNHSPSQSLDVHTVPTSQPAASPGTLLASFASPSHLNTIEQSTSSNSNAVSSGNSPFDLSALGFSHLGESFFADDQEPEMNLIEMEDLLNIGGQEVTDSGDKP